YVNVNLDEPFGLGKGQSKEKAKKIGVGNLYMNFSKKIFEVIRSHNKEILMWGDVLKNHEEILTKIPNDVTILEWNYDGDVNFNIQAKKLMENKINFYLCPGTSSWNSITGRTENMCRNIDNAIKTAVEYNVPGLIVTDWGDNGHLQSYPVS